MNGTVNETANGMAGANGAQGARRLMTAKDAAAALGVSARMVTSMCARGDIKTVKVGRVWRINRDALAEKFGL